MRALIIDDDREILTVIRSLLGTLLDDILTTGRATEALELIGKFEIDFLICDVVMPEMDGFELLTIHP